MARRSRQAKTVDEMLDFPTPFDSAEQPAEEAAAPAFDLPEVELPPEPKKVSPRYPWEVTMKLGGRQFGPFSPSQGAVDASEAINRVVREHPNLTPHLSKCRWATKRLSKEPINGDTT